MTAVELDAAIDAFEDREVSSASFWDALESLVEEGDLSCAERREIFWDAHSREGRLILERQEPRFNPENKVWEAGDETAVRTAEYALARAMRVSYLGQQISFFRENCKRWLVPVATTISSVFALILMAVFIKDADFVKGVVWFLAAIQGTTLVGIGVRMWSKLRSFRNLLTEAKNYENEDLGLESSFVDPNLLLESTGTGYSFRPLHDFELSQRIGKLVEKGLLSHSECRQLFWDFHSKTSQESLANRCSLYSPQHPFWTSKDEAAINKAESLLVAQSRVIEERVELNYRWLYSATFAIYGACLVYHACDAHTSVIRAACVFFEGLFVLISAQCIGHLLKSRKISRELHVLATMSVQP